MEDVAKLLDLKFDIVQRLAIADEIADVGVYLAYTELERAQLLLRGADLDLGRWFSGTYAVPVVEEPDGFEDTEIPREAANDDDEFL